MAEEVWKIIYTEEAAAAPAVPSAVGVPQARKLTQQEGFFRSATKYLPLLGAAGGIAALVKYSKITQTVLSTIGELFGTIIDVFLMPFMPLFAKIFEAIAPLVPKLAVIAEAILGPLVSVIMPIVTVLGKVLGGIADMAMWIKERVPGLFTALGISIVAALVTKGVVAAVGGAAVAGAAAGGAAGVAVRGAAGAGGAVAASRFAWLKRAGKIFLPLAVVTLFWELAMSEWGERQRKMTKQIEEQTQKQLEESFGWMWPENRQLGGYVSKTGHYFLHRGEEVVTRTKSASPIYISNNFTFPMAATMDVNVFATDVARKTNEALENTLRRLLR